MEAKRKKRYLITFLILILCVIAFLLLNICIGTVQIPLSELKNAVMDGDSKLGRIVLDIRAPRSFAAMILGGALALAGYPSADLLPQSDCGSFRTWYIVRC